MTTVSTLKAGLDRKIWQQMTPSPTTNGTAMFTICDVSSWDPEVMYITSATAGLMYNCLQDAWINLPSSGIAGTFGAGACGVFHPGGATGTATAGTTTTITTNLTLNRSLEGMTLRITAGTNAGQQRIIKSNTIGANSVITVQDAFSAAIDTTSQYQLNTGRYYFFNPSTTAPGFRYYDRATNTWTALSVTGVATSFGTDGNLVSGGFRSSRDITPPAGMPVTSATATTITTGQNFVVDQLKGRMIYIVSGTGVGQYRTISSNTKTVITVSSAFAVTPDNTSKYYLEGFSSGTASAGASTTMTDATKAWATNQWTNFQVRIVAGTGAGQIRVIASNTSTVLTVSAAWTVNPDATSQYIIEGDDNALYLLGNNAVTLYKYSISGNTWATLTPGVARSGAPGAGMSSDFVFSEVDPLWTDENNIINGRRIYSFRGGASATIDYYDIATNNWTSAITYLPATETFTTGSSWNTITNGSFYGQKDATGRCFAFRPGAGTMTPISTIVYPFSTATVGAKVFSWQYVDGDTVLPFMYVLASSLTNTFRTLIY